MTRAFVAAAAGLLALLTSAGAADAGDATLSNPYLSLRFDPASGAVAHMAADAGGHARYGADLLAGDGLRLGGRTFTCDTATRTDIACHGERGATVSLHLGPTDRGLRVRLSTPADAALPVTLRTAQWFMAGVFSRGAVQYVAGQDQRFAATSPLALFYTMDRARGSVALVPNGTVFATLTSGGAGEIGLALSAAPEPGPADRWEPARPAPSAQALRTDFTLYGNDRPYPAHLPARVIAGPDGAADRDAALIAAYGSAAGVLGSYLEPGAAYPTLAQPNRTYGDAFTFFDPDAWSTVATLSFSGDALLQREARGILERAARSMLPDGQIPHHFDSSGPVYVSLAKSRQTGPNIFWTLAAIEYATASGDEAWLRARYPTLKRATEWLLTAYDPARRLIRADGPLFIDVFRRDGFTLDTNMMAAYLLDRMAGAARFAGDTGGAVRYDALAGSVRAGLAALLAGDHYVTQLNPDGSRRDFVDDDGNYGAVAFGVPARRSDAAALVARLDAGPLTHPGGYGTWVSQTRYEKSDCYGGNDGDSDTAMARIWWLDMRARVAVGDRRRFDDMLERHRALILGRVWMTERIGADGTPIRAPGYHEYPEILEAVTRELRYGIRLAPDSVTISPFGIAAYDYAMGGLRVTYGQDRISIRVPGSSARAMRVEGLSPGRRYQLSTGAEARVSPDGVLAFHASAGAAVTATALSETKSPKRFRK